MSEMGKAMMGTGEAEGERRAIDAAESAISNPLLDDVSMKGAKGILINITGGYDMTLYEVDEAANRIREEVDPEARIIFGSTFNEAMEGRMRVSVVATGIDAEAIKEKMQQTALMNDVANSAAQNSADERQEKKDDANAQAQVAQNAEQTDTFKVIQGLEQQAVN
jgi:cell division protein FtsZ